MRSKDIKKKKKEVEYEEASIEDFGEDSYQSPFSIFMDNFNVKYNELRRKKTFIPIAITIGIACFALLISIIFITAGGGEKGLTSINGKFPSIVYLGEEQTFRLNAYGEGDLSNTIFNYSVSNGSVAELKETELTGNSVSNTVKGIQTGTFHIIVKANRNNKSQELSSPAIAVCERLTDDKFENKIVEVKENRSKSIVFKIGPKQCSDNVKYKISDASIASVDEYNIIHGIRKGTTTITLTEGLNEVTLTLNVI